MLNRWIIQSKGIMTAWLLLTLAVIVACGSSAEAPTATSAPQESQATQSMPELIPPVSRITLEAPDAQSMPELIPPVSRITLEAPDAQASTVPAPVVEPTGSSAMVSDNFGGDIPMADYAAPSKRYLWQAGSSTMKNMGPMFNTLVEWDPEDPDPSVIRGDLAESWEILDDGLTYIFHLNKKANWHNGLPVTADDVVFSLDAMLCPDCFEVMKGQRRTSLFFFRGGYEVGQSRAIDDKTVEIKLNYPLPAFLDMLSLSAVGIGPKHTILGEGKIQNIYQPEDLNGSGPFLHVGYIVDVKNEFVRNPDYWKEGYPRIDSMSHFIITDPGTTIAAFKSGQVLMQNQPTTPLNPLQAVKLGEDMAGELEVRWAGPSGFRGFQINTTKKPFDDQRVRQALNLAIHRQPIIEIISGGQDLLGTPLPPDTWYSYTSEEAAQMPGFRELNGEKHPDDLLEARRLLADAGFGGGFQVEFATRDAVGYPDVAAIIADQLRTFLDWDVTLKVYESAAGYVAYDNGEFQFNLQGSTYNFDDPSAALLRYTTGTAPMRAAGGDNKGWIPEGLEELVALQAGVADRDERKDLVLKAHDIMLNQDNNYVGVYWSMRHWPISNRIQNINMHPSGYANHKLEHMWCDPKC